MDIAHYSSDSREVIKNAKEVAASLRHPEIDVEHLLIAVVRNESSEVEAILNSEHTYQRLIVFVEIKDILVRPRHMRIQYRRIPFRHQCSHLCYSRRLS